MQVIAYDQDNGMYASRLWWLLRWMGHDAVAVLDGGFAQWIVEGRLTASGEEHRSTREFVGAPRNDMLVDAGGLSALCVGGSSRATCCRRMIERARAGGRGLISCSWQNCHECSSTHPTRRLTQ